MDKPRVYVKYCGGCNPRFDRTAFISELFSITTDDNPLSLVASQETAQVILNVCGCTSRCIASSSSTNELITLWVTSKPDAETLLSQISNLIKKTTPSTHNMR